ncbi:hypothetical protein IVA95_37945 [Bradyrhizobium sp. 157]|uniref:hypothetical protein n=1 Tax=Bradyrhizobium sp. 157 TaxID=2782631 RepID=UPI001FF8BA99|nr:hypothetical protein [Bradyrhizobium sp. 157]MCK1643191.1 hypothetical protein [Bradyrhizobium sp. 157]
MQTQRIVLALVLAIGGGTGAAVPAFSQEYRGTWEQQMACTPDVWRLCGDQIPDVSRIVVCLRQNTPQLSPNCRAVFESQADAQPAPRGLQQNAPRARAPQPQVVRPRPMQPPPYYEEQ